LKTRYFYGYNIVAAGFITQAVTIGVMFTYGVFFKAFQTEFGWSRAMISGASSLSFLLMGIGGLVAGSLNDRIGPKIIMTVSAIFLGTGYMLMSCLVMPWHLYLLYGGLVGIGFCTHDVITLSTIARWFVVRRGMMSGLVKVGTGAGQFLMPLVATWLIAVLGWRHAYLFMGALAMTVLVAAAQLMRRDPQGLGLQPDNGIHDNRRTSRLDSPGLSLQAAARTKQFWIICIAEFAIFFCLLTTIVHIIPHAQDKGLNPGVAAAVLSTIGAVSMLGRIIMGTINDKIGGRRSLITCFILLISSLLWLMLAASPWMFFLFAAIYGFAHGGFFTVMSPTIAELFGTRSHGLLFGTVLFCGTIGGAIGPLLTGYIFDTAGSYQIAFVILTVLSILGCLLIAITE
jgi:MFS family permease